MLFVRSRSWSLLFVFAIVTGVFFLMSASAADAATLVVNTTGDSNDGAGSCGTGTCSLRDAITQAAAGDTITFATGVTGTITLSSALPAIAANGLIIQGPGSSVLTVSGNNASQIFINSPGVTSAIEYLTVANGAVSDGAGGAILNSGGSLYLINVIVSSNQATGATGAGGAVYNNGGTLNVSKTTFSGNSATLEGGAIYNSGTLLVADSTFTGNSAPSGAILYNASGLATISNSTFTANTTSLTSAGGIQISSGASATISNVTVVGNSGNGIANLGTLNLTNSLLDSAAECSGSGCPAATDSASGNVVGSLNLAPLGNNGGPTQTMLPLKGSPAICAGLLADFPNGTAGKDQRNLGADPGCNSGQVDAGSVQTAYLTVNTNADPGAGSCTPASCSLRDALTGAIAAGEGNIAFDSSLNGSTITLSAPLPDLAGSITLSGPGPSLLTISGANAYQIFRISNQATTVSISGLTFSDSVNNAASSNTAGSGAIGYGGAVYNIGGTLTVNNCAFKNNSAGKNADSSGPAILGAGAGILNGGTLTLTNTTFSGNSALGNGYGGALMNEGTLAASDNSFSNNTAYSGGAVYNLTPVAADFSYSTFSGNTASDTLSGAIYNNSGGNLVVQNITLAGNTGGISNDAGATLTVTNSVFAETTECHGTGCPTSGGGGNIWGGATLSSLGSYGGSTETIVPLPGSIAICGGLQTEIPAGVTTDQRGYPNTNSTYSGYSGATACVDSGAVQTNYTGLKWVQQPSQVEVNAAMQPAPTVEVLETNSLTSATDAVNGVPVALTLNGAGAITGGSAVTAGGLATFSSLLVNTAGTGDSLSTNPITVVSNGIGTTTLPSVSSSSFDVTAGPATTTVAVNAALSYSPSNQSVTLSASVTSTGTVNEGTVTFTILAGGTPVGTAVSSSVSSGTASVSYVIPGGTTAGIYTVQAAYVDSHGSFGSSSDTSHTLTIGKATPTVTWPNPTAIVYGTALSSTQLNATTTISGISAYTPGSGTVLTAGPQTLSDSFTPADTTNYNTVTATAQIMVNPAVPVITWANPASITYGTALSSTQLDATANVPGSFLYSPAAGTVLSSGTQTLSVTFTPSDTIDYTTATATAQIVVSTAPGSGLQYVSVAPCRIADTRLATGPFGGPEMTSGSTREFDIPQSTCNIPSTAVAYSLNVTVVPDAQLAYLTVWPAGQAQPLVSTLNSDGRVKANAAIVPAGSNGGIDIYATDATQVVLDINGYFVLAGTASALAFYPVTPCRVADTRNAVGSLGGPTLSGGTSRDFPVQSSSCGIPATAQAYSLNITAVPRDSTLGYLTLWPTGETQPNVSTLNSPTGEVVANAAIVPAGTGGDVSIYVTHTSDVVMDIDGYFAPPGTGGLSLYTVSPCRVIDTRNGAGAFSGTLAINVEGSTCAPPATAQAYVFNSTVVPSDSLGYLTLWPDGGTQPIVSTLNSPDGSITSNMAIVPTTNGSIDAYSTNPTQLVLDMSSYFAPESGTQGATSQTTGPVLTVQANDESRVYGTSNPAFSGSVTGAVNGDTFTESFTTSATIGSSAGQYLIMPVISGTDLNHYTVVLQNGMLTVTKASTSTSLSVSSSSINPGSSVTLSAAVNPINAGTPTGTVSFYDGTALLNTANLINGTASYSTSALSGGVTHAISAVYNGDVNFGSSTTSASLIAVAPLSFTLAANPGSLTGSAGGSFSFRIAVAPAFGSYPGAVQFAASGIPSGALVSFSPETISANAGPQVVTMNIKTSTNLTAANQPLSGTSKLIPATLALLLLPFGGAQKMRRQARRFRGFFCLLLFALTGIAAASALTGCGSAVGHTSAYTINVMARSGSLQQTTTVDLNLQ